MWWGVSLGGDGTLTLGVHCVKHFSSLRRACIIIPSTVHKAEWVSNKMEGLADTTWDVVIEGTGLEQSLLAL